MPKQNLRFRLKEEEVGIHVSLPSKVDVTRADVDFFGCDFAAAATYMEEVAQIMRNRLQGNQQDREDEQNVVELERWEFYPTPEGEPRLLVTGKFNEEVALFAKEWKYMDLDQNETAALPRPPKVKHQHDEHCMTNFKRAKGNPSLSPFIGNWTDKCAVIVGSGPSLNWYKEKIPADDPRFEVIAINETCKVLEPEQIDYVFLADRAVGEHEDWFPEEVCETSTLISSTITSPNIVDKFEDVHFWRSTNLQNADDEKILRHVQHLDPLDVGQTSTYSALHFVYRTGAPYILFVGQDYCSTTEMYSPLRRLTPELVQRENFSITSDMNGDVVLTCPRLMRNMRLLKGQSAFVADDGRRVTNASGRGMFDLEAPPCTNSQQFTPENCRNLDIDTALQDAKSVLAHSGKSIENSEEVMSCPGDIQKLNP